MITSPLTTVSFALPVTVMPSNGLTIKGTLVLPCLTSLDTAREVLRVVANRKNNTNYTVEALQDSELE